MSDRKIVLSKYDIVDKTIKQTYKRKSNKTRYFSIHSMDKKYLYIYIYMYACLSLICSKLFALHGIFHKLYTLNKKMPVSSMYSYAQNIHICRFQIYMVGVHTHFTLKH